MPYKSIVMGTDENYVFVLNEDNTVTKKNVTLGVRVDELVQVTEGLSEGEKVIVKGQNLLSDGASVNVVAIEKEMPLKE